MSCALTARTALKKKNAENCTMHLKAEHTCPYPVRLSAAEKKKLLLQAQQKTCAADWSSM